MAGQDSQPVVISAASGPDAAVPSRSAAEHLLAAKFAVPARPDGFVDRPRLTERLALGVEGPLTLVSAPAGTGKTVAVAAWASGGRAPGLVVWVSLDDADVAPAALWTLILDGLRRNGVDIGSNAAGADIPDRTFLFSVAAQIATHPEPVVLVLDCDGTLPKDGAAGLHHVMQLAGPHLRLVLLTRADPMLPLHRYRLADAMVEIRMADLAFTTGEAAELLTKKGVDLPPATMDVVTRRTRGWVAGLILTAMSLVHRADPEEVAEEFTGDSGAIAEYLLAEVLDVQPVAARDLLLSTSVVDVLSPGLVEALAGPSAQRALTFLAHGNAFLEEIPESTGCYRYHPLFRDLLRAQLAYESPDRAMRLHRKAASWMAEHGLLPEAVRQAAAGRAWEEAARYVVDDLAIGQLLVERRGPLADALAKLPPDADGTSMSLVRAARVLADQDVDGCAREIAEARRKLGANGTTTPAAELAVNVLLLAHARATGDGESALEASAAIEALVDRMDPARLAAHPEITAIVGLNQGIVLLLAGHLEAAADAFSDGAAAEQRLGCEGPSIDCLGHLALIAAWDGRLRRATDLAGRALEVQTRVGIPDASCPSAPATALAWVHAETYDMSGARHHLQRATELIRPDGDAMQAVMLGIVGARIHRAAGDLHGAMAVLAEAQSAAGVPAWLSDRLSVEQAALEIRAGEPERALAAVKVLAEAESPEASLVLAQARLASGEDLTRPIPAPRAPQHSLTARVDGLLLEAWRRLRQGEEPGAASALDRSLRLAAPERLRRPFREAPRDVRQLMRHHEDLTRQHSWLSADPAAVPRSVPEQRVTPRPGAEHQESALIVEPLTEKEREVLGHLAELLTTDEIGAAMFVSVNTVRTHVRNILRKMSASRRNEAVRRARELQILPSPWDEPPSHEPVRSPAEDEARKRRSAHR